MDLGFFKEILGIASTSGEERTLAEFLAERLPEALGCTVNRFEVGDGTLNLLFDWSGTGHPSFVFCTHMDTVPPYLPPTIASISVGDVLPDGRIAEKDDTIICGRGSCDAKGQIFAFLNACKELHSRGERDFGLLLLSGEEIGSFGAKAYTRDCPGGSFVLVGEPTDNCLVTASKGTQSFGVTIRGKACHSGYPAEGESAVEKFVDFVNLLRDVEFPEDPVLGPTTWNIGKLQSDNAQNILSPEISFRLYFRTTFASHALVQKALEGICPCDTDVEAFGGDDPLEYFSAVEGIESKPVAFGSDAPRLTRFPGKGICGPGSILVAHTDKEYVLLSDLQKAVEQDVKIYRTTSKTN